MARPKTKTKAESNNAYMARAYDAVRYQTRKDSDYNKAVLQAVADRLTGGSVTGLINAALQAYIPAHIDATELDKIIKAGHPPKDNDTTK
jgi:hypothetical protein